MSLAKQISSLECSTTPPVALHGSKTLDPGVLLGDSTEAISPSSKIQLERGVSRTARLYALRQLMLRAAVPQEIVNSWKVEVSDDATVVGLDNARIRFRHAPATFWCDLVDGSYEVVHADWPCPPCVLAFATTSKTPAKPDFHPTNRFSRASHCSLSNVRAVARVTCRLCVVCDNFAHSRPARMTGIR